MRPITRHFLLLCIGLLALATSVLANPTFTIAPLPTTLVVGQVYDLKIVVTNFTEVDVFQFAVDYDETKLEYQSIALGLSPLELFTFHRTTGNRLVTFSFANVSGETKADGFVVATIKMRALTTTPGTINFHIGSASSPVTPEPFISALINGVSTPLPTTISPDGTSIIGHTGAAPITGCHLIAPFDTAFVGSIITVPIRAVDFEDVSTISYSIEWDPSVLSFISYDSLGVIPGFNLIINPVTQAQQLSTNAIITNTNVPLGFLQTVYPDNADFGFILNGGITVPDSTVIYNITFQVVGQAGDKSYLRLGRSGFSQVTPAPSYEDSQGEHDLQWIPGEIYITNPPTPLESVTFRVEKDTVLKNGKVCVDVSVDDFENVTNFRLGIAYDQTKLTFDKFDSLPGPLNLTATGLGPNLNHPNPGEIRCVWEDLNGKTLAQNTVIYSQCFTSKGNVNTTSALTISNFGLFVNEVGINGVAANMIKQNGSVFVTDAVAATIAFNTVTNVNCPGGSDGAIAITASGAPNLTYAWAGPNSYMSSSEDITGLKAGTYVVTVTSSNGLSSTATRIITEPAAINLQASNVTTVNTSCNGGSTGTITLAANAVTGGTSPYTYAWTGPGGPFSTRNLTGLQAGTYALVITDSKNCTATGGSHVVGAPAAITVASAQVTRTQPTCFGDKGSISLSTNAVSGGAGNFTYAWTGPGGPYNTKDISNLNGGTYILAITDGAGCTASGGSYVINAAPAAIAVSTAGVSTVNISCSGGSNGSILLGNSVSGGTGTLSYAWSGPSGFTSTNKNIAGLSAAGAYSVTITDANSCSTVAGPYMVTAPSGTPLSVAVDGVTNQSCSSGAPNGAAQITASGGTLPYTYRWLNNGSLVTTNEDLANVLAGTYTISVTDVNGCTTSSTATVGVNSNSTMTVTAATTGVSCSGGADGGICLTVNNPSAVSTVSWSPALTNVLCPTGVPAGTYQATITDTNGCPTLTTPIEVTQPQPLSLFIIATNDIDCNGDGTGSITASPTGGTSPYGSCIWNGGTNTGYILSNLQAGTYTPVFTDGKGCTSSTTSAGASIVLSEPDALVINLGIVNPQDGAASNGSIDIDVSGGVGPYTYTWAPGGQITQDISGLSAGSYSVTIQDANACTHSMLDITVSAINQLSASISAVQGSCSGSDGCVTFSFTGGAYPLSISYQNTSNNTSGTIVDIQDATFEACGLEPGDYMFTVEDANNVTYSMPSRNVPSLPAPNFNSIVNPPFDDNEDGSIQVFGNGTYNYGWNDPLFNGQNELFNLDSGTYIVTITNPLNGCTTTETFILPRRYEPYVWSIFYDATLDAPKCVENCTGKLELDATGGDGPTYAWHVEGPNGYVLDSITTSKIRLNSLCAGTYIISTTDESGVERMQTLDYQAQSYLTATQELQSDFSGFGVSGANSCDGQVAITPADGITPYNFFWSDSEVGAVNNNLCAGAYDVTVTDGLGCTTVLDGLLTSPDLIIPALSVVSDFNGFNVSCNGESDGIARIKAVGGLPPYEVEWSTGQTSILETTNSMDDIFGLAAGMYSVTVTDVNGISTTSSVEVFEPAPLQILFTETRPETFTQCDGQFVLNTPAAAGDVDYVWSLINGTGAGSGDTIIGLCAGNVVQVNAVDANGCQAIGRDTINYPDDGCFQLNPVITPGQADGKNDILIITCIESAKSHQLEIFNRWGQLVFETESYDNFSNAWKGANSKGQPLPEGVYYYVLNFTNDAGNPFQIKGYVNLIR